MKTFKKDIYEEKHTTTSRRDDDFPGGEEGFSLKNFLPHGTNGRIKSQKKHENTRVNLISSKQPRAELNLKSWGSSDQKI